MDDSPAIPALPPSVTIREFQRERDIQQLYQVMRESYVDNWYQDDMTFEDWQNDYIDQNPWYSTPFDPSLWFIAYADTRIVGAALCRWERPGYPTAGHITDMFVHPTWRRRGIGSALLAQAFSVFYQRGKQSVRLGVDAGNTTQAAKLYEQAGMNIILKQYFYEKNLLR